jgi:hypothetical protein
LRDGSGDKENSIPGMEFPEFLSPAAPVLEWSTGTGTGNTVLVVGISLFKKRL